MKFISWVPAGEQVCTTWEETSLEHTEDESERNKRDPCFDKTKGNHSDTPEDDNEWQEQSGSKLSKDDSSRGLKGDVGDEEDQDHDAVSVAYQEQVDTHAGDDSDTGVGSVHQRYTVHETKCWDKTVVDFSNNLSLLLWSELSDGSIVGTVRAAVAGDLLDLPDLEVLLVV